MMDETTTELDLRGLKCPLPVLKTRNRLRQMQAGEKILVRTDDPMALIDIPHFCREFSQILHSTEEVETSGHRFLVERSDLPLK